MREDLEAIDKNFFILDSETSSQVIACLSFVRGCPEREALNRCIQTAISRFPRARSRLVVPDFSSAWAWEEDEDFSLENHLFYHVSDRASSLEELLEEASRVFSRGLDPARPLWALHVLTSPRCGESIALFLIHHGFSDGGGGMEFFHAMCEPRRRGVTERKSKPRRVAALRRGASKDLRAWTAELNLFASARRVLSDWGVRRDEFPFHGRSSTHRRLSTLNMSLEHARIIKDALDVSLNDVFLGYVSGALRKLSSQNGTRAAGRAFLPFNLRPRSERRELGNFLSAVPIPLHVNVRDPIRQVLDIHTETLRLKSDGSFGAFGLLGQVAAFLPRWLRRRLLMSACRRANFICTNVPSSRQQLIIGGAPVIASYGCAALLPEQGLAIGFMSYVDSVCVCIVSDPAIVPEPRLILDAIAHAEQELFQRVLLALPGADREPAQAAGM